MTCILCFNHFNEDERYGVYDYSEPTMITGAAMVEKVFGFSEKILFGTLKGDDTCICRNCWINLESFHEFYCVVEQNYNGQLMVEIEPEEEMLIEEKFQVENESDLIVYDAEEQRDEIEEYVKEEYISEDYIEEVGYETPMEAVKHFTQKSPKKIPSIRSIPTQKLPRSVPTQLDSADDQKIRETATMTCELCLAPFESLRDAKHHFKSQHGIEGYIVCCDRKFRQRCRLLEHVNTHFNVTYNCSICGKNFDSKSYLVKHQACHDTNKLYECDHCPKTFSRKFMVRNHLLSVHIFDKVEPTFPCPIEDCGKKFVNKARLKHHLDYTHATNCTEICEYCSKSFRTKNAMDEHLKTHMRRDEDRIRCDICGHYLADLKSYNRHLRNHSTEQLDNTCKYCGKRSPNQNALKKHIRYVHELEKSYQCKYCDKSFKRSRNLMDHEAALHTHQDLYKCSFCHKTFRNQSNMLAHRKKQHPELYQKPKYMRD